MKKVSLFFLGIIFLFFAYLFLDQKIVIHKGATQQGYSYNEQNESSFSGYLLISPFDVEEEILDFLVQGKYHIRMRNYLITEKRVIGVLKNLASLGVKIDILLENEIYGGGNKSFHDLKRKLIGPYVYISSDEHLGTNFIHAKTILIDKKMFIISTANFTYPSFWRNREYRVVGYNDDIIENLLFLFERDRNGKQIHPDDIHPILYVCPIDCRTKISSALYSAEKSIIIESQYIEDPKIIEVLKEQKEKGRDIRIVVGEYQDLSLLGNLKEVTKIVYDPYIHAKNILIDNSMLLVGSANLSQNALDNNREIGIFIKDEKIIQQFQKQFEYDFKLLGMSLD